MIFGKSKDSILVPDYLESKLETNTMTTTTPTPTMSAASMAALTMSSNHSQMILNRCLSASNNRSGFYASDADFGQPVTTRVLTDENGHSIKVRIASPPPQRQAQLAKLHQDALKQQTIKQQVVAAAEELRERQQQASVVSERPASPLMWAGSSPEPGQSAVEQPSGCSDRDESPTGESARQCYTSERKQAEQDSGDIIKLTHKNASDAGAAEVGDERAEETDKCQLTDGNRHRLKPAMLTYVCHSCFGSQMQNIRSIGPLSCCVFSRLDLFVLVWIFSASCD